jgi:hypothetical protein
MTCLRSLFHEQTALLSVRKFPFPELTPSQPLWGDFSAFWPQSFAGDEQSVPCCSWDMTLQQLVDEHVLIGSRRGSSLYIRNFADFPKSTIPAVAQTFGETGPS